MSNEPTEQRQDWLLPSAAGRRTQVAPLSQPSGGDAAGAMFMGGDEDGNAAVSMAPPVTLEGVLRSKWLILGVFVLLSIFLVPAIWLLITPTFSATAVVRVSPIVSRIAFNTEENGVIPLYTSYLNTQVSIIRSPTVLRRVLDREDVRTTAWYNEKPSGILGQLRSQPSPLERFKESLQVRPRPQTELIDATMTAQNGLDAKLIVDAVVEEYVRHGQELLRESGLKRLETLEQEFAALQREIDGLIATKFNVSKQLGTTAPEELRSQLVGQLALLEADAGWLERDLAMAKWDLGAAAAENADEESDESELEPRPEAVRDPRARFAADPEWRRLYQGAVSARHRLELAHEQIGESHPRMALLQSDLDHAERLLEEHEARLGGRRFGAAGTSTAGGYRPPEELERTVARFEQQATLLKNQIERKKQEIIDAGEVAKQLAHYDEEIRHKRELYAAVRTRLNQLELESNSPARISIATPAMLPSLPDRDRRVLFTVMALGLALSAGVGLGYLRAMINPRIDKVDDVAQTVRAPFLGQLPPLPKSVARLDESQPAILEAVRMVRTALLRRLGEIGGRVILVTSSTSRAGKTSTAVLLGRSLAKAGKNTLLVEADLRRPTFKDWIDVPSAGLASLLCKGKGDDSVIVETDQPRLSVLPAGQMNGFDAEHLANGVFASCLARWRKKYDIIILDSPPLLPVADARILGGQADGTILVLRSAHSHRGEALQALAALSASGATLLGTVLVGVESDASYYGYYGYASLPAKSQSWDAESRTTGQS